MRLAKTKYSLFVDIVKNRNLYYDIDIQNNDNF